MTDTNKTPVSPSPEPNDGGTGVKRPDQKNSGAPALDPAKPATGGDGAAGAGGSGGFGTGQ